MTKIHFKDEGIAHALKEGNLFVPANQREYSWEEKHVLDLYEDIADAISKGAQEYFLGSIVVATDPSKHKKAVFDGQQRLATTSIFLAAIRDYFHKNNEDERAKWVADQFLTEIEPKSLEYVPKLRLSKTDHDYYLRSILPAPDAPERISAKATKESHEKIEIAQLVAAKHVAKIVAALPPKSHADELLKWVGFLEKNVKVIWVEVPDDRSAYVIFETMNDRGLHLSMADLLKNHIFALADDRMEEAEKCWYAMVGALETVQEEDILVTYIRHLWISTHGPTRSKLLFDQIKNGIKNKLEAIGLIKTLEESAPRYAALLNPAHTIWQEHNPSVSKNISTLAYLRMEQVRPLLLGVTQRFTKEEVRKCSLALVYWSVRFLIVGVGSGTLEGHYGRNALEIWNGKIKNTNELIKAMASIVPTDDAFESAFRTARVTQARLARYYLRALQRKEDDESEPYYVPSDGPEINLEHILPQSSSAHWKHIDPETARAYVNRIGNLVLMQATPNNEMGDSDFVRKKKFLATSEYSLTKNVSKYATWGTDQINDRQSKLAKLAVKAWPLKPN